jgi:hypothetical protein
VGRLRTWGGPTSAALPPRPVAAHRRVLDVLRRLVRGLVLRPVLRQRREPRDVLFLQGGYSEAGREANTARTRAPSVC